jgi:hypothetical protein
VLRHKFSNIEIVPSFAAPTMRSQTVAGFIQVGERIEG